MPIEIIVISNAVSNLKLVVNGDPSQIDLINKSHSGLIKSREIRSTICLVIQAQS